MFLFVIVFVQWWRCIFVDFSISNRTMKKLEVIVLQCKKEGILRLSVDPQVTLKPIKIKHESCGFGGHEEFRPIVIARSDSLLTRKRCSYYNMMEFIPPKIYFESVRTKISLVDNRLMVDCH